MESFKDQNEDLYELKAQKRMVIRKGKKIKKYVCPEKGFDLEKPGSKKCVKVSASKQLKKEKRARKSAKKAKAKKAMASLKRKKSMKKRKMIHQKFRKEGFLTYADFIESVELDEGRMKELHMFISQGKSAEQIAKIMKLDVKTIKALMKGYKESVELDEGFKPSTYYLSLIHI